MRTDENADKSRYLLVAKKGEMAMAGPMVSLGVSRFFSKSGEMGV